MTGSSEFASYEVEASPLGGLQAGSTLGSFRILYKLGEGGMGEVWAAEHLEIGLRAAVKVLRPEYSLQPEMARRFFNEARAVNIVQHPGIVKVFEFGRLADRTAFIVMEFLEGEVLADRMERLGSLPCEETLLVVRQIASILATAHARNVVHRDLKPANVMMVPDPEAVGGERAKLLDFGLAKLLSDITESGSGTHLQTRTGLTMGTPVYMAPEQCRGERDVSGLVDVYALGVLTFEMLAGKPPFQAKSGGELMSMHLRDEPPALRSLAPQVPQAVAALVHAMMTKDPAQRPTMAKVMEELRELSPVPSLSGSLSAPVLGAAGRSLPREAAGARLRAGRLGLLVGLLLGGIGGALAMELHGHGTPPTAAERVSWLPVESGTKYHLRVVWGWPGDMWAAGDNGTALHWNGRVWNAVPTPTTHSLRGVWGEAGNSLYAVGGHGTVLRWNGLAWSESDSGVTVDLRGGSGQNDVWVVGKQGTILHGDGATWTAVPSGVKEDLRSVWGSGAKDVWAVGEYGVILHWDGVSWSRSESGTQSWLQRVWGSGGRDLWAVGNEGTVLHWDGQAWAQRSYDNPKELSAVWGDGRGLWTVGSDGTILSWSGSMLNPEASGTRSWLYGLWGVPGRELWAVGAYGVILRHAL